MSFVKADKKNESIELSLLRKSFYISTKAKYHSLTRSFIKVSPSREPKQSSTQLTKQRLPMVSATISVPSGDQQNEETNVPLSKPPLTISVLLNKHSLEQMLICHSWNTVSLSCFANTLTPIGMETLHLEPSDTSQLYS